MDTTRRQFLTRSLAAGCSLAASPLVTPVAAKITSSVTISSRL